jgi:hypothetical protein
MTAVWGEHENLPFAPGASPFHVKGIVYRGHVDYANRFITGGATAVAAAFRNPALTTFYGQQFLAASWYDALPLLPAWFQCAKLLNQPPIEFLRARTRHQAEQDIRGVYRWLVKIASAEAVAQRVPRVVGQYFDFGTTDASVVRPGVVRLQQTGLPVLMAPWFATVSETFVSVALEIAGAKQVTIRRKPLEPDGKAHGLPLGRMVADVEFDTARASAAGPER